MFCIIIILLSLFYVATPIKFSLYGEKHRRILIDNTVSNEREEINGHFITITMILQGWQALAAVSFVTFQVTLQLEGLKHLLR